MAEAPPRCTVIDFLEQLAASAKPVGIDDSRGTWMVVEASLIVAVPHHLPTPGRNTSIVLRHQLLPRLADV